MLDCRPGYDDYKKKWCAISTELNTKYCGRVSPPGPSLDGDVKDVTGFQPGGEYIAVGNGGGDVVIDGDWEG